jgi:drug/metabolite transporter (DMT)-like permease
MRNLHDNPYSKTATLGLLVCSLIWGATFVIVKISVETVDPLSFVFGRFTIAFIVLAAFSWKDLRVNWRSHLPISTLLGIVLFAGFILQVFGLERTSSSNAGFITGLSVVLVAVLDVVVNKRLPTILALLGFLSALSGLLILSIGESHITSFGNILVFGCAVAFGLHVFWTDKYSKRLNVKVLTTEQIGIVVLISLIGTILNGRPISNPSSYAFFGIMYTGVLATALAYFLQTWSQKHANAMHSAVVLSAEPVFAATFAVLLISEPVTNQLVVGGLLVIIGAILSSLCRKNSMSNM